MMGRTYIHLEHDGQSLIAKPGAGELRGRHIVVEAIQTRLQRLGVDIPSIDDSPVKVFTHTELALDQTAYTIE